VEDGLRALGRFLWKLTLTLVVTFAVMALIGLVVRLVFGLELEEIRSGGLGGAQL
jgi:hypothetical protein